MRDLGLAAFTREIEARDPEAYAAVLRGLEGFVPVGRLDAQTIAAIIVAMEKDGHIDADSLDSPR
jgi:hypothetical protein